MNLKLFTGKRSNCKYEPSRPSVMATIGAKRKAPTCRTGPEKRQRIETFPTFLKHEDEEDDDDDFRLHEDFSEDEQTVDTPVTPFSPGPGRKKFPSELKTIKCTWEKCTKTFNRPARLTAHLRTHTNERPFVCNYDGCDKAYFQEKHLQAHIKGSHTHERSFVCDWEGCGKSFLTSTRLKRHNDTHIGHERFRCTAYPPCNQTFRKHQTLQRHINSEHLELAPYQCHYIDPITNRACSAGFDGANGLRQHVERIHGTPRFFCPDCLVPGQFDMNQAPMHLGFVTEKAFQAHVRKEHANCAFCELKCRSQRELQKHIETLHSGSTLEERKNIPCTYAGCDRRFTKKNNLTAHIRTAHMGERFICGNFDVSSYPDLSQFDDDDGCGSDFVSKQYLVDHIRTSHLGLPSVLNANRKKASSISDIETDDGDEYIAEDFSDGEEEQYSEPKRTTKRASKAKSKSSTIDDLIGVSYENDPKRKTPCPVLNCPYRFIRNYDLQVHLRTSHQDWVPTFETPFPPSFNTDTSFQYPEPSMDTYVMGPECSYAEASMSNFIEPNADIEWELQRQAMEGGAFWVGSDDSPSKDYVDQEWTQEVEEMRRLIG